MTPAPAGAGRNTRNVVADIPNNFDDEEEQRPEGPWDNPSLVVVGWVVAIMLFIPLLFYLLGLPF